MQRTRSAPKSPHAEHLDAAARTLASPVGPDTPSRISRERSRKPSVPSDTDRVDHHPSESPRPFLRPTTPVRVVSLETRLAELRSVKKRISPPSTAAIMYQLTRAVAHAAGLGVCHGDITPSCVLLSVPSMHISLTGIYTDSGTKSICFLPPRALESHMHALKRSTDRRFWSSTQSIVLGCEGQAILVTAASLHHRLGGIVEPGSARRFDSLRLARDPPPFDGLCDGACTPSVCHQARCTPCTASVRRYYYRCAPRLTSQPSFAVEFHRY